MYISVKEEIPDNSLVTMNRTLVIKKLEKDYDHKKKQQTAISFLLT